VINYILDPLPVITASGALISTATGTILQVENFDVLATETQTISVRGVIDLLSFKSPTIQDGDLIINTANISPAMAGGAGASPTASGIIIAPKLTMTNTVSDLNGGSLEAEDILTYTLIVKNEGTAAATNLVVTNPIPLNTFYFPGGLTLNRQVLTDLGGDDAGDYNITNPGQVTVVIPSLAGGGTATISFVVRVNSQIASGSTITDQATLAADQYKDTFTVNSSITAQGKRGGGGGGGGGGGLPPVCGDGLRENPEQCDDGNKVSGDGCSERCQKEITNNQLKDVPLDVLELFAESIKDSCLGYDPKINRYDPMLENHWASKYFQIGQGIKVKYFAEGKYLVSGYENEDGTKTEVNFGVDDPIARVDAVKFALIGSCFNIEPAPQISVADLTTPLNANGEQVVIDYTDVDRTQSGYPFDEVYTGTKYNITIGYPVSLAPGNNYFQKQPHPYDFSRLKNLLATLQIPDDQNLSEKRVFLPANQITRAELLKILMRTADVALPEDEYLFASKSAYLATTIGQVEPVLPFSDVDPEEWYYPYVLVAKTRGYISGYADGTFHPNASATRAEALTMLFQIFKDARREISVNDEAEGVEFGSKRVDVFYLSVQELLAEF
jgi:uncharacterized repeat protein (TIGR01451 family)